MKNKVILVAVFALAALLVWSIFSGSPPPDPARPVQPPAASGAAPAR